MAQREPSRLGQRLFIKRMLAVALPRVKWVGYNAAVSLA